MLPSIYKVFATTTAAGILLASVAAAPLLAQTETMDPPVEGVMVENVAVEGVVAQGVVAQVSATDTWRQLEPGASHTTQIKYDARQKDGQVVSETLVQLEMGRVGSVEFDVYTADQYEKFVAGDDITPIGRGNLKSTETGNTYHNTKLLWANRTSASETFYIRVRNRNATTSSYQLSVGGNGTSIQNESAPAMAPVVAPVVAPVTAPVVAPVTEIVASTAVADGPSNAISDRSDAGTLAAGETRWYTFKYDYDQDSIEPPKQATVQLKMNERGTVAFELWTPKQIKDWVNGEEVKAVGAGSVFEDINTTLVWVGSARATDRYYVLVENLTDSPAGYSIEINGLTVSN